MQYYRLCTQIIVYHLTKNTVSTKGEKPVHITGARLSVKGTGTRLGGTCVCFSRYNSLSILQISPFKPSPSHPANESLSDLVPRCLAGSTLLGGGDRKIVHRIPNALSATIKENI